MPTTLLLSTIGCVTPSQQHPEDINKLLKELDGCLAVPFIAV